jgi:hypothetical protein
MNRTLRLQRDEADTLDKPIPALYYIGNLSGRG